ncbi:MULTISPECIES: T6SS immunity protein Tli4 family protein [Providencia]|uniref:T6SS immunity protein Tli4 family protein n=1 Tax=Providencia TaxID=586 RepID=UPI002104F9D0|nr:MULTISPECIES: T6SS immunity protein Tli4 family protein [Providencia]
MQLTKKNLYWGAITLTVIMILVGLILFTEQQARIQLTDKEKVVIENLFEKTKPQCIGRYVIDVPDSFSNRLHDSVYISDFKIESQFIYPPAFKQRIELREEALRNQKSSKENSPALKEIIQLPDGKGVIFDRNISGKDDLSRILEAHVYTGHITFIITVDILDLSNHKYSARKKTYEKAGFSDFDMNEKPYKLAAMRSLISRLNGRLNHEIPTEKGVCIPNGFILDNGEKHSEKVGFAYNISDFIIGLQSDNTIVGSDDTLFNRSSAINESLNYTYFKSLQKQKLSPNGIPAETWLFGGEQNYDGVKMKVYKFDFYANEATSAYQRPWLNIVLNSEYRQTSYSEAQMVEIWDRIIESLRYKPNAF